MFGGDFNVTKCSSNIECVMLENFCLSNKLLWCDTESTSGVNYTFHNYITNHFSLVDHFVCSPDLTLTQCSVMVLKNGDNLSDHLAITCIKYNKNLISVIKHVRPMTPIKSQISFCWCNGPWI